MSRHLIFCAAHWPCFKAKLSRHYSRPFLIFKVSCLHHLSNTYNNNTCTAQITSYVPKQKVHLYFPIKQLLEPYTTIEKSYVLAFDQYQNECFHCFNKIYVNYCASSDGTPCIIEWHAFPMQQILCERYVGWIEQT